MELGHLSGLLNFVIAGREVPIFNVVVNCVMEEDTVLRHYSYLLSQRVNDQSRNVLSSN